MKELRVLVVDDEPLAREGVRVLLEADDEVEVVGEAGSGGEAVEAILALEPDIVFLDIQMPEMNGFEVLDAVDLDPPPVVVFVTAYDEYAIRAFEVHALDYLLKPFDDQRFERALERAKGEVRRRDDSAFADRLDQMLASRRRVAVGDAAAAEASGGHLQRLVVKSSGRVNFVDVDELLWVEAAGDYVRLHTENGSVLMRETMKAMEDGLDPEAFVRIHRSTIVRLSEIREIRSDGKGSYHVVLQDGTERSLSTTGRDRLESLLGYTL